MPQEKNTPASIRRDALGRYIHSQLKVRHARTVLGELCEARHNVHAILEGRMVCTSIGTLPASATSIMPAFIAVLESRAPQVMISVREGSAERLLTRLRTGGIDFAVSFLPVKQPDANLTMNMLLDDGIVAVVRPGHPLEQRQASSWSDLMDYPLVLPPQSTFTCTMIDAFWNQRGVNLPPRQVESLSIMTNVEIL